MAELHSNIYYKHSSPEITGKIESIFFECNGDEDKIKSIASSINPEIGSALADELINFVINPVHDLSAESINKNNGYTIAHFVHGRMGDENLEQILIFLYSLVPDIHAQAWGCGDDDPWEFWLKHENGNLIRKDDEPTMEKEEDQEILNTIYAWWHVSMPDTINEGLLNDDQDIDLDNEYIVFTGKMTQGTREQMEELAEEYGANIQKSINKKTTLLVVGDRPGNSKLNKAKNLNVRIVTESEFNDIAGSDSVDEDEEAVANLSDFHGFESLKNLHTDKASEALQLLGKNSFSGVPFTMLKELSKTGVEANESTKHVSIYVSQGSIGACFLIPDYSGGLDVDFNDVATVALSFDLTTKEEIQDLIDKNLDKMHDGIKWEWEIDDFKCELEIRLSPATDNTLFYKCDYKPKN